MTITHSAEHPPIIRLHGKILYPFDISEVDTDGGGYTFEYKEIEDTGQDITDASWLAEREYEFRHEKIVAEYENKMSEGFLTSLGIRVDCKEKNISDFHRALSLLSLSGKTTTLVRDYYNKNHTVSTADFMKLCKELGEHAEKIRHSKWLAVDAIGGES